MSGALAPGGSFSLRVAINGSETDVDVENDSAQWYTKVVGLRITGGGGSPTKSASLWACEFSLDIPIEVAPLVRTITVAVEGPWTTTVPVWAVDNGGTRAYRIVFNGDVVSAKAKLGKGEALVEFNATDEMYGLFLRRARCAAVNNTYPGDLMTAIETAHSLTIPGNSSFPNNAPSLFVDGTIMQIDQPAQKRVSNGEYIKTALAGTGVNCTAEWDGTITAPELYWRPDFYLPDSSISTTRKATLLLGRPWCLTFDDVGYNYADHYARYNVNGEGSAGTQYYGWARLDALADRNALGNREYSTTGYWDSAGACQGAALNLLAFTGYPSNLRPFTVSVNCDYWADALVGWAGDEVVHSWYMATAMLGDEVQWLVSGDAEYESVSAQTGAQTAADLESIWITTTDNAGPNGTSAYGSVVDEWHIRQITREWDPQGGWTIELGCLPNIEVTTDTVNDAGSGTD